MTIVRLNLTIFGNIYSDCVLPAHPLGVPDRGRLIMKKPLLPFSLAYSCKGAAFQTLFGAPSTLDKGPHASQGCRGNRGQSRNRFIVRTMHTPPALDGSDGTGVPRFVGRFFAGARSLRADEDGTKGSEGDHAHSNASLDMLPNEQPNDVECAAEVEARYPHSSGKCHEEIQGQEETDDQLLACSNLDGPK